MVDVVIKDDGGEDVVIEQKSTDEVDIIIFNKQVDLYVKRADILESNLRKAYSLVWGQCTESMKNKLEALSTFAYFNGSYDVLTLVKEIRDITYKFEDQRYLPAALHQAKCKFYTFRQGSLSNADYFEKYKNLYEIVTSSGGEVADRTLLDMTGIEVSESR